MKLYYMNPKPRMSSHVSLTVNSPDNKLENELRNIVAENGDEFFVERSIYLSTDTVNYSYNIFIRGGGLWGHYRSFIIGYIVTNELRGAVLEMDRDGDCMDKNVKYTYVGDSTFNVEYETDELSYDAVINVKV